MMGWQWAVSVHTRDNNHPCRRQIDFLLLWSLTNATTCFVPKSSSNNCHLCQIYSFPLKKYPFIFFLKLAIYLLNLVSPYKTSKSTGACNCAGKCPSIPIITEAVSKDIVKHNEMIRNDWLASCLHTIYLLLIYYLHNVTRTVMVDRSSTGLTKDHFFPICWASFFGKNYPTNI